MRRAPGIFRSMVLVLSLVQFLFLPVPVAADIYPLKVPQSPSPYYWNPYSLPVFVQGMKPDQIAKLSPTDLFNLYILQDNYPYSTNPMGFQYSLGYPFSLLSPVTNLSIGGNIPGVNNPQPFSPDVNPNRIPSALFQKLEPFLPVNPIDYVLAINNCYGIDGYNKDFTVWALRGSLYLLASPSRLMLARGRMLIACNSRPLQVVAGHSLVVCLPNSLNIVETSQDGLVRVLALASDGQGHEASGIELSADPKKSALFKLKPGQEMVRASHDLSAQDLKTADNIARRPLEGDEAKALSEHERLYEFSLAQLADFDAIFNCPRQGAKDAQTAKLKAVYERVLNEATKQKEFPAALAENSSGVSINAAYEAVSNQELAAISGKGLPEYKTVIANKQTQTYATNDSVYTIGDGQKITLVSGMLLATSKKPLVIVAGDKEVHISRKAIALVKYQDNALKVINLSDLWDNSLGIVCGKKAWRVGIGREALFTMATPSLAEVFDVYKIGHRITMTRAQGEIGWLTSSQISVGDVVVHQPLVQAIKKNGASKVEKKLLARVTKTAATLATLEAYFGPFVYGEPEDQTGAVRRIVDRCNHCMN